MVSERIRIGDEYYLLASALAPRRLRQLLNYGDSFVILDSAGDIPLAGMEPYGLFHAGTRFLDSTRPGTRAERSRMTSLKIPRALGHADRGGLPRRDAHHSEGSGPAAASVT